MFNETPKIDKISVSFIANEFNFSIKLMGDKSEVAKDYSNFGISIYASDKKINNVSAFLSKGELFFLPKEPSDVSVYNGIVSCIQRFKKQYEQANLYVYIGAFEYIQAFNNTQYSSLAYRFSNAIELNLKTNGTINNKNVLDYSVIDALSNIEFDKLSENVNTDGGISNLYTSFISDKQIRNHLFINHKILSKLQQEQVTNIINYNSKTINRLLLPVITIRNSTDYLTVTEQILNNFDCLIFDDFYNENLTYDLKINYNTTSIVEFFNKLILEYRTTKNKSIELSIFASLNIDTSLISGYISFITQYQNSFDKKDYDFVALFDKLYEYINYSPSSSKNSRYAYNKQITVHLPYHKDKYLKFDKYIISNDVVSCLPSSTMYNGEEAAIEKNSDLYNTLLANKLKADNIDFNSIIRSKSISIIKKEIVKQPLKSVVKNNLVEDYKLTNQKIAINDVYQIYPTDLLIKPELSVEQQKIINEKFRKLTHKLFGTIDEYQNANNLNMTYIVQMAKFDSNNLKTQQWVTLTKNFLDSLQQNSLVFVRLLPNNSDIKVKTDIFNFSYNTNQLIQVGELLQYVS